jgi:hypothetical protein
MIIPNLASYFQSNKDVDADESSVEESKETEQTTLLRNNDLSSSYGSIEELFTSRSNEPSCVSTPHSSLVFDLSLSDIKKSLVDKNRFIEKRQDKIKNLRIYEINKSGETRFRRFSARQLLNDLLDEIENIESEVLDAVDASDPDDSLFCYSPSSKKKKRKPSLHHFLLKSKSPFSNSHNHHSTFPSSSNRKNNSKNEGTQSISIKDIRKFDPRFSTLDSSSSRFIATSSSSSSSPSSSSSLSSLSYESSIIIRKHVVLLITVSLCFFLLFPSSLFLSCVQFRLQFEQL